MDFGLRVAVTRLAFYASSTLQRRSYPDQQAADKGKDPRPSATVVRDRPGSRPDTESCPPSPAYVSVVSQPRVRCVRWSCPGPFLCSAPRPLPRLEPRCTSPTPSSLVRYIRFFRDP